MSEKNSLIEKVKQVIEELRPYLQGDGGDVEYVNVTDDMVVQVRLKGACGSCPFRLQTLKNGVEQAVKKVVPEIKEVVAVD
jgi:Fe-S cluster biogenesis protein NfuA